MPDFSLPNKSETKTKREPIIFDLGRYIPQAWTGMSPLEERVRRNIDTVIPDLELRAMDADKVLQQRYKTDLNGPDFSLPQESGRNVVLGKIASGEIRPNYLTGFISSAASSLPEFFGMPAPIESEVFRIQNPWMGLATELVGPGGAYGAAFKISKAGKFASALGKAEAGVLNFFGTNSKLAPAMAAGTKELLRYTPLELSRLGVGFTVWPENAEDLSWDVALGSGFNFAFGAAGGVIKQFGKTRAIQKVKGLIGAESGLLPTFKLRLMKDPQAQFEEGADVPGLIKEYTNKVLTAKPGQRTKGQDESIIAEKPFWDLDVADDEAKSWLDKFFRVNSTKEGTTVTEGLDVRLLTNGTKFNQIPKAMQTTILKQLGLKDTSDAAAALVFPRVVKVTDKAAAGRIGTALDKAGPGLKWSQDEGVLYAQDGQGLWVVGKKVGGKQPKTTGKSLEALQAEHASARALREAEVNRGFEGATSTDGLADEFAAEMAAWDAANPVPVAGTLKTTKGKTYGKMGFGEGDVWLFAKTDRLDLFLPQTHAKVAGRVKDWALLNARYRPGVGTGPFAAQHDLLLSTMDLRDWESLRNASKSSATAQIANKLKRKLLEAGDLADSRALKETAERFYDIFVPTARKEVSSPVYGRLWATMKGMTQFADEVVGKIARGAPRFTGSPVSAIRNMKNVEYVPLWKDLDSYHDLIGRLTDEEASLIAEASRAGGNDVAAALEALTDDGLVSDTATEVIRQLQEANRRLINEYVMPTLKDAGVDTDMKWLEGYIMPKLMRGEHYIDIKSGNRTVERVNGKTAKETQELAAAVVAEAEARGMKLNAGELQMFDFFSEKNGELTIDSIMEAATPRGSSDKKIQDVMLAGYKRALADRQGIPKVSTPGTLKERTDLKVNSGDWSKEDIIKALNNHNRTLLRWAGMKYWQSRWMPEMRAWAAKGNDAMARDLERKGAQLMGIQLGLARGQEAHMKELFGLAGNKPLTKLTAAANSIMYQMMLGIGNLNFAILNVVTPIMTTMPWVSFMTRAPMAKQLQYMQTTIKMGADGKPTGVAHWLDPVKFLGKGLKLTARPDAEAKALMERAIGDGTLDAQLYENFVGGAGSKFGQSLRETWSTGGGWEFIKDLANAPATKSEQLSRLMAFNTALSLGRDFFDLSGEALYRFARKGTEQSMYMYGLTDRARIMTGPLGSTLGLFKNWQFHYINQMAEYVGLGVKDGVWAPAMWMMGTTAAVGGIGAVPLKGALDGLANIATNGESETAFQWLQQNWGEDHPMVADTVYFGLPGMLGASLQSSATMPGTDIVQDTANLANIVSLQRAIQLGTAVKKMSDYAGETGQNPFSQDQLRAEFLGTVLPRSMARLYAVTEEDAILSMRSGYPTVRGVSGTTKLLYGLGLNQTEVDKYAVAGRELYKQGEDMDRAVGALGMEYADAMAVDDYDHLQRVVDKAIMLSIPVDKVLRSAQSRQQRMEGDNLDKFDQGDVEQYFVDRPGK